MSRGQQGTWRLHLLQQLRVRCRVWAHYWRRVDSLFNLATCSLQHVTNLLSTLLAMWSQIKARIASLHFLHLRARSLELGKNPSTFWLHIGWYFSFRSSDRFDFMTLSATSYDGSKRTMDWFLDISWKTIWTKLFTRTITLHTSTVPTLRYTTPARTMQQCWYSWQIIYWTCLDTGGESVPLAVNLFTVQYAAKLRISRIRSAHIHVLYY